MFIRSIKTIIDMGIWRILRRIKFEIQKKIDSKISPGILLLTTKNIKNTPEWKYNKKFDINTKIKLKKNITREKEVIFCFVNQKKKLNMPIIWHDHAWSRLWQFNLHYFDWAKQWIEDAISLKQEENKLYLIDDLLDQWIKNNPIGKGDGWHSYTTSLRIRNWVFIFRLFPEFLDKERLNSLWHQICWLNSHKEYCYGGNHLIENLTALIIGALQYKGIKPEKILKQSLTKLEQEISKQILIDGGHEERTASYHLLMLDRLVECGFYIQLHLGYKPDWLIRIIDNMTKWTFQITLFNDRYPRFNDTSFDPNYSLTQIKNFALSFLNKKHEPLTGARSELYKQVKKQSIFKKEIEIDNTKYKINKNLIDLKQTGWTIIKPGEDWELLFKCGKACPRHLPAHCHSDLLSFELNHKGKPIFSEFGTSTYGNNKFRKIERSSYAHNSFQLSYPIKSFSKDNLIWIEPIEVWNEFRAGRKANPKIRNCNKDNNGNFWVIGSHDGYKYFGAHHLRKIKLKLNSNKSIDFTLIDEVNCSKIMAWRQCWHLGPDADENLFNLIIKELRKKYFFDYKIKETWHSEDFSKRLPRKSIFINGFLKPGKYSFKVNLNIEKSDK